MMVKKQDVHQSLDAAAHWCAAQGYKLTAQRREVLALLLSHGQAIKAYPLLTQLQQQRATAAPTTVYRALNFLVTVGLVHHLEASSRFIACQHQHKPHQALLLICQCCNRVDELDSALWPQQLQQYTLPLGFSPKPQDIEIYGTCYQCMKVYDD